MTKLPFLCFRATMLILTQTVFCQPSNQKAATDDVRVVAESVLSAIQKNDAKFLSKVADPKGITLGFDSDPLSADQFRRELSEKRGAYCVIFDISCLREHKSPTAFSLRQALANNKITLSVSGVEGQQDERVVEVKSSTNPNEVFFVLFLRHANGEWVLQQIEYF